MLPSPPPTILSRVYFTFSFSIISIYGLLPISISSIIMMDWLIENCELQYIIRNDVLNEVDSIMPLSGFFFLSEPKVEHIDLEAEDEEEQ